MALSSVCVAIFTGTLFIFHKGLHRVAASLKTSHLRQPRRLREGFPCEKKSTSPWVHDANLLRRKSLQFITKIEKKLNIITLEHVFVPRVRVFDPIESVKSASFESYHRSDQEWSLPLVVHLSLNLFFGMRQSTRSPSLISLGLTFLLRNLRVSSCYLPRLIAAWVLMASIVLIVGFMSSSKFSVL